MTKVLNILTICGFEIGLLLLGTSSFAASNSQMLSTKEPSIRSKETLTVDAFLRTYHTKSDTYLDAQTRTMVLGGTIIISPSDFSPDEFVKVRSILETGQWTSASGQLYDLRNAHFVVRDEQGGIGDQMAYLLSEEFGQILDNPFHINYPPSPYRSGMSPGEYLEALLSNLKNDAYVIDGISGAIEVPSLTLPLHNLDKTFCLEVIAIAASGTEWTGPSGGKYDLRKTTLMYPAHEIGTPEQQKSDELKINQMMKDFFNSGQTSTPGSQTSIVSTGNSPTPDSWPTRFSDRFNIMIPFDPSPCSKQLAKISNTDHKINSDESLVISTPNKLQAK